MLSVFPELFTYGLLAPFILRVVLGALFLNLGILKFTKEKSRWITFFEGFRIKPAVIFLTILASIETIGGILLIIGLFTQVVALVFAILTFAELFIEFKEEALLKRNIIFYLLVFAISLSLLFSGAGFFAFDLPL